jgi:hypothetical protein
MNKIWIALGCVFLIYSAVLLNLFKDFKQLPSPVYGGDYYYQLGSVYHIINSPPGDWFKSSSIIGNLPSYSPIYGLVVGAFSIVTGLQPLQAMLYSNFPFLLISLIAAYALFYLTTKNEIVSIIGVLVLLPITVFPVMKYTELMMVFGVPLFLIALYLLYEKQTLKRAVFLGLAYGFLALLQPTGLVLGTAFVLFFLVSSAFSHVFDSLMKRESGSALLSALSDKERLAENVKRSAVFFLIAFVIGFLLAQIWWFKPIFELGGQSPARVNEWGFPDFTSTTYQFIFLLETVTQYFFNLGGLLEIALSALGIVGIYLLFLRNEDSKESRFVLLAFAVSALVTFHYFLTVPLIGTFFGPNYLAFLLFKPAFVIVVAYAAARLLREGKIDSIALGGFVKYLPHLLLLLIAASAAFAYDGWYHDKWKEVARQPLQQFQVELQKYLLANTSVNDVVLSTNELSFTVHALSGRKEVAFRRGHVDGFSTFDDREVAAAAMLYGNNTGERVRLLRAYNVSYVYFEYYWVQSEWTFDQSGNVVGSYDPIAVFDTPENRRSLDQNGVKYAPQNTWLDPSSKGGYIRKVDILYVTPSNYQFSQERELPWSEDLDKRLQQVWKSSDGNAMLYKVTV